MNPSLNMPERPLEMLDIGADEERVYRWLLARPGATTPDVAQALELPARRTQRVLDGIEMHGLVTYSPGRPRRYFAAPPDMALEALLLKRMEGLHRVRDTIRELQAQASQRDDAENLVELITSREAELHTFEQLQRTAQHEIVGFVRLPIRTSRLDIPVEEGQGTQREAQRRGVHFRSIVDTAFLELPGVAERVLRDVEAGEEIRVAPSLPFKMAMADRKTAFIPLSLDTPDSPSLLVRSSALVDALHVLFEVLWERAVPFTLAVDTAERATGSAAQLSEEARTLMSLLAAGLVDKAIAQQLGISASTLHRRIVELMATLGAGTRFQMGWLAALRFVDKSSPHD